jgi:hypothetical protein
LEDFKEILWWEYVTLQLCFMLSRQVSNIVRSLAFPKYLEEKNQQKEILIFVKNVMRMRRSK